MDQILSRELRKVLKIQISEVHMYIVSATRVAQALEDPGILNFHKG